MNKEKYISAELEIINFFPEDIIMTSDQSPNQSSNQDDLPFVPKS